MSRDSSYFKGERFNALAKKEGFRSRAAYKLIQIQKDFKLIKSGDNILDLGSAPGGWSQVASNILSGSGSIIAIDLLPMKKITNVDFHQLDLSRFYSLLILHLKKNFFLNTMFHMRYLI